MLKQSFRQWIKNVEFIQRSNQAFAIYVSRMSSNWRWNLNWTKLSRTTKTCFETAESKQMALTVISRLPSIDNVRTLALCVSNGSITKAIWLIVCLFILIHKFNRRNENDFIAPFESLFSANKHKMRMKNFLFSRREERENINFPNFSSARSNHQHPAHIPRTRHYFNVSIIRSDYIRNISLKCLLNVDSIFIFLFIKRRTENLTFPRFRWKWKTPNCDDSDLNESFYLANDCSSQGKGIMIERIFLVGLVFLFFLFALEPTLAQRELPLHLRLP